MPNFCKIIVVGNVTRDPEIRNTGRSDVCNCGLAYNDPMEKDKDKKTTFYGLTIWGKSAVAFEDMVHKGDCILVEGKFSMNKWQGKDGIDKEQPHITVATWSFMGQKQHNSDAGNQQSHDQGLALDSSAPY